MLVWLNGPNGIGKTQVAHELSRGVADAFVCDPEHLGFAMRRMLPRQLRGDFREMPLWRAGVVEMLSTVLKGGDASPVIVPMTVRDPVLLAALIDPLGAAGHVVHHVTLLADRAVLARRIRSRGESATRSYAGRQIDDSLRALRTPGFARHLHTDGMTIAAVAADIAAHADLPFTPDPAGPLRRRARRLSVQIRHARFDELLDRGR
ncbi:AAA family ATPase [Frankia sp. AgB32]|uniref:AAA family ATPase n=1 Tax=Frankia sp. AgB32 TaxID=631119 RepID=UPI00200FC666|nr:AAA family ATPase [Frankia sp. AgB32]MCK9896190.1 RNA helicase domain-containing protein [Frankia sp. AgB32]